MFDSRINLSPNKVGNPGVCAVAFKRQHPLTRRSFKSVLGLTTLGIVVLSAISPAANLSAAKFEARAGEECKVEGQAIKTLLCFKEGKKLVLRQSVLIAGTPAEPASLDPIFESNLASVLVMNQIYDRLVRFTSKLSYEPQLAESYAIAEDSLSIKFTLRKDAVFASGRKLTAADVVYSFDRLRSAESINKGLYSAVTSVVVISRNVVEFRLSAPSPFALLAQLAVAPSYIMDKSVVAKNSNLRRVSGGSGPFALAKWNSGSEIILTKNNLHFNSKKTGIAQLTFKIIPDEISAVSALRAGTINWFAFGDPIAASLLKGVAGVKYSNNPSLAYLYLSFNTTKAPFSSLDFRTAISYALDRSEINKLALEGRGEVTGPMVPALTDLAVPLTSFPSYTYSVDKSKALLAKAGASNESMTLHINGSSAPQVAVAPIIVSQLAKVGTTVRIVTVDSTTWFKLLSTQAYDLILGQSGGAPNPDVQFFNSYTCTGAWNYSKICDAAYDDQIEIARAATGAARILTYKKLQSRIVNVMMPYLFISTMDSLWGWSDKVTGFTPLPLVSDRRFDGVTIKS